MSCHATLRTLLAVAALWLAAGPATAQRTETAYSVSPRETAYNAPRETGYNAAAFGLPPGLNANFPADASTETRYNAKGTWSALPVGLISTRRDDPEYPGFQLGIQWAAGRSLRQTLNVAPASATTLDAQINVLRARGVDLFLVDSPVPAEAADAIARLRGDGARAVLLTQDVPPPSLRVPTVIHPRWTHGEVMAEAIIRAAAGKPVTVGYVSPVTAADDTTEAGRTLGSFLAPFAASAPAIRLVPIDPQAPAPAGLEPDWIVFLSRASTVAGIGPVMKAYPKARLVGIGEDAPLREMQSRGLLKGRVRPDYLRLVGAAMVEANRPAATPPILRGVADIE